MPYKDPEDRRQYQKRYNKKYREENRQYFRDAYNKWSKDNPEKNIKRRKKYLSTPENRKKSAARTAVYYAIKKGILVRPGNCSQCNITCKPEADHADYDKKLDVVWLCKPCHTKVGMERL